MPTPAEGGNPPAPARRMVPLYRRATTTTTRPPLPVDSREQLVYLLTQAAELEQGILCEYLFALYSLKRDPGDGLERCTQSSAYKATTASTSWACQAAVQVAAHLRAAVWESISASS